MGEPIRLHGVRQNNLKNFDLEIQSGQLTVITGVSGSGKSSLAFDTLFAEGQRRYIETFSPYARQFFDRMDKPRVDRIEGIPPAVAIEQKNTVKSTRSTVGTMTEICDFVKVLWPHFSVPYCTRCDVPMRADSAESIWDVLKAKPPKGGMLYVAFAVPLSVSLGIKECLQSIQAQGFQRCCVNGELVEVAALLEEVARVKGGELVVVQDRLRLPLKSKSRLVEACEQAFKFGRGRLVLYAGASEAGRLQETQRFSRLLECATCGEAVPSPSRSFFSSNSPVGACPACRGFGRVIGIDYRLAIPDPTLSLAKGAIKLWQKGHGLRSQKDMMKSAKRSGIRTNIPFGEMTDTEQQWVIYGDPGHGSDREHRWPKSWYGVKGYFDWLETKAYKMHVRVLLSRYRVYRLCPDCQGTRFKPEVLRYRVARAGASDEADVTGRDAQLNLAQFYQLSLVEALAMVEQWRKVWGRKRNDPIAYAVREVESRLKFMIAVGLSYLQLDRPTKTLSGGETERINLTSCLGTHLVNTLFVLDEPSVGLHAADIERLVRILQMLRDAGNTVVVVEHESAIMRAADQIVDIGPKSGAAGGHLVFTGTPAALKKCQRSVTGRYLAGRQDEMAPSRARPVAKRGPRLRLRRASCHNIHRLNVDLPLERLVGISGVSGSGKTTLVKNLLYPQLCTLLGNEGAGSEGIGEDLDECDGSVAISGWESLRNVHLVDQSPVGKTPRSTPALYVGAFDDIRKLFASSDAAKAQDLGAGVFSFNSRQGQCDRCRGAGFEKIEMQFLSDVFVQCPDCDGLRYRRQIRDFRVDLRSLGWSGSANLRAEWSIDEILNASVDEVVASLTACDHALARRAVAGLEWLQRVGLGYLQLGQPINTLSGGESQRLKVVRHLNRSKGGLDDQERALFIFDEPTTGLHFHDIRGLVAMFQSMVDRGHSVIVIEHHLELLSVCDWILDLGPGGGHKGGQLVAAGKPEDLIRCRESVTGRFLATLRQYSDG